MQGRVIDSYRRVNRGGRRSKNEPDPLTSAMLTSALSFLIQDSLQSREMQQRSVTWFGTVLASVVFGGLVYATTDLPNPWVLVVLYGVAGPLIAILANLVFLGELVRLGRAAVLWRSIERHLRTHRRYGVATAKSHHIPALFVESAYVRISEGRLTSGYGAGAYYLSVLALFGGGWVLSLLIGFALLGRSDPNWTIFNYDIPVMALCAASVAVMYVISVTSICRQVLKLSRRFVDLTVSSTFNRDSAPSRRKQSIG